jgi:activator of HSP90 ATPase
MQVLRVIRKRNIESKIWEGIMTESRIQFPPAGVPHRRQIITGAAVAFVGSIIGSVRLWGATTEEISHSAEAIHQETLFRASRKRVYEALTDAKQYDKVMHLSAAMQSGMALGNSPTEISREVGGPFTLYGGHILGRHIELVPNERIVQAWRVATWSPSLYSIAKFDLVEQGSDTKLVFDHTGFPVGQAQHLAEGWKSNYWEPLAKFLA